MLLLYIELRKQKINGHRLCVKYDGTSQGEREREKKKIF